jgi:hypothetical protein
MHPNGTVYLAEWPQQDESEVTLLGINGQTGAVGPRIPLPLSSGGEKTIGCTPGNDRISEYALRPGAPMVAPDGSVYIETQSETWILDYLPCNTGGTNIYDSTVRLLQVRPDGSTTWRDVKQYSYEGYVDFHTTTLPPATLGEVIPDGQGGLLAGWTYHVIDPFNHPNPVPEARITHFWESSTSEYALPFTGWGYCISAWGCGDNDYGDPPNGALVLGENGMAMAGRWSWNNTTSSGSAKIVAFDVNSGAVTWSWESGAGWIDVVAATTGNALIAQIWSDDGTTHIIQLDSTGQLVTDPAVSTDPAVFTLQEADYYANHIWLGTSGPTGSLATLGSVQPGGALAMAMSGPLYYLASSPWPLWAGNRQGQRADRKPEMAHFVPVDPGGENEPALDVNWFRDQMLDNVPESKAAHIFYLKQGTSPKNAATITNFRLELGKPRDALAFVGHSKEYRDANLNLYSVGLCFSDASNGVLTPCLIKEPEPADFYYGTQREPPPNEYVPKLESQAKVVFVAACALTDVFKRFINIHEVTRGRALVVSTSPETLLGTASQFWTFVASDLANGLTVGTAVDNATQWFANHPREGIPLPSYVIIGDRNVRIK